MDDLPTAQEFMDRMAVIENELMLERQVKQDLQGRLASLQTTTASLIAALPSTVVAQGGSSSKHGAKPAKPSEYDGDHANGRTFLQPCTLYLHLHARDFLNKMSQILWVLSFMKSGRAVIFATHVFTHEAKNGVPLYPSWKDFGEAFRQQFFPLHEAADAMSQLESRQYHQDKCSIDEYINGFEELVERAEYTDGGAIVMKFRRGLDPSIQSRIALMLDGRPKDDDPPAWYTAVRTVALTRAVNEAFQAPRAANNSLSPSTGLRRVGEPQARFASTPSMRLVFAPAAPAPVTSSGAAPMEVDLEKRWFAQPLTCRRCGKVGHFAWECPQAYDVRYMKAEERDEMLQHWLMAEDVRSITERQEPEDVEQEDSEDFVSCSE
jgi:Retrotransposon gag protein/Zinc knuckle